MMTMAVGENMTPATEDVDIITAVTSTGVAGMTTTEAGESIGLMATVNRFM